MNTATAEPIVVQRPRPLLAWGLLVLMALVWGSSFILIKRSLAVFPVGQVAAGRIFFAFLFFLPMMLRQIRRAEVRQTLRNRWWAFLISGTLGFLGPAYLFAEAGAHINSSLAGALNSLSPLFTLIIGALFFRQRVRWLQVMGIVLGFTGTAFLIFYSASGALTVNGYALLVVLATVMYGININTIARYLSHLPALMSTTWIFAFVGPPALGILLTTDFFSRVAASGASASLLALLFLGVMSSGVTSIIFNRVVQLSSGIFASSVTYLMPMVALMWGMLDHERIGLPHYIGMAVCLFGVYLVNRKK
ncbi:DMT family transporter [Nibrella viscosa]|uniref:DMT family transporter n=1 Tax=Nibrella viscosa TaxID=1084524 RepID=A0ABP8K8X4_9BACT